MTDCPGSAGGSRDVQGHLLAGPGVPLGPPGALGILRVDLGDALGLEVPQRAHVDVPDLVPGRVLGGGQDQRLGLGELAAEHRLVLPRREADLRLPSGDARVAADDGLAGQERDFEDHRARSWPLGPLAADGRLDGPVEPERELAFDQGERRQSLRPLTASLLALGLWGAARELEVVVGVAVLVQAEQRPPAQLRAREPRLERQVQLDHVAAGERSDLEELVNARRDRHPQLPVVAAHHRGRPAVDGHLRGAPLRALREGQSEWRCRAHREAEAQLGRGGGEDQPG